MHTRTELLEILGKNICTVTFEKTNGEERVMKCTLKEDTVVPHERKTDKERKVHEDVIPCFDTEKNAWRSFKISSMKSISY